MPDPCSPVALGRCLLRFRLRRGLTQEELAAASAVSVDCIRRLERGRFSPTLRTLEKIAEGLHISLSTFFCCLETGRSDEIAELCDWLSYRSALEVDLVARVLKALVKPERPRHSSERRGPEAEEDRPASRGARRFPSPARAPRRSDPR